RALKLSQYLTLAAVLLVTTVGGYLGYQRFAPREAAAARVTTAEVSRGAIVASVIATGSVASPTQSELGFKSGGRLAELLVNVGDAVEASQPLARIDDSDLQVALLQAQANYSSAVAKLEQTKAGSKPEDIAAAQAQLDSARAKLEQAQAVPNGPDLGAARSQLESAKIKLDQLLTGGRAEDVAAAQAQLDAAQAKLDALLHPRPEDLAAAQSQVESGKIKLDQLRNPRPEDVRSAEAALASAQAKLNALLNPRPEDLAAAQAALDQQLTKLAQLNDQPRTAKPEDIANAELAVQNAQVAYDKALADAANAGRPGASLSAAAADAAIKQALITLQTAQNNLGKIQAQGPSEWDVRMQQEAVTQAQASLEKLKNPSPADVQAATSAGEQAQASLDKLKKPSPYDVQAAQEALNQAQASLEKLRNPSPADVAAAQQAVAQAQAGLDKLLKPSDFDVRTAQQAVVQAQASVDRLLTANVYDVRAAVASVTQAQANLDLKAAGPTVQDIAIAMAAVEQAQAQVKQAEANLAGAVLTAPYSGVIATIGASPGEQVSSAAVVTLVDTREVRVEVVVDETDVAKVQAGQQATVTFEALPDQRVPGRVIVVAPTATVQQGVVNYTVQIQVDPSLRSGEAPAQAGGVRPGMTATASIVTASKEDVLLVPNRSLRTQGRTRTVEVLEPDGTTASRPVQTGMANDQVTEILGGLQPGDRVVIPTTTTAAARVPGFAPGPGVAIRR
ncbi:MAG: efflux RND transporter periplasmic adaptor subunit, partial [Chloroflexota bacterium]